MAADASPGRSIRSGMNRAVSLAAGRASLAVAIVASGARAPQSWRLQAGPARVARRAVPLPPPNRATHKIIWILIARASLGRWLAPTTGMPLMYRSRKANRRPYATA